MAMRETERSLAAYLVLSGVLGTIHALNTAKDLLPITLPASWAVTLWFYALSHLVLGIAYVIAGVRLKSALPTGAGWIRNVLQGSIALLILDSVLLASVVGLKVGQGDLILSFLGLAITIYLLVNLRRLAAEAMVRAVPPARVVE